MVLHVRRTICRTKGKDNRPESLRRLRSDNRNISINNWYSQGNTGSGNYNVCWYTHSGKRNNSWRRKGVLMTLGSGEGGGPEMAMYTGEGIGRIDSSGSVRWRGFLSWQTFVSQ